MKRTTIFIDEAVERELRAVAEAEGRPASALVREALGEYLERKSTESRRTLGFVAAGRSGRSDIADRHEELLWEESVPPAGAGAGSRAGRKGE